MPDDQQESAAPLAEISHGPSAFEEFLERNQKNLIIAAILIALGVAGFVVWQGVKQGHEETAGAALNNADDIDELQAILDNHPKSTASGSAAVLLANRQWTDGQQDAAIATLRDFIASKPGHAAIPSARASLGAKLMSQGKSAEAVEIFEQLADDPNARYIAPYALICIGDIANADGDLEKAETSYNKVITDFSDTQFVSTANERLSTLKAKPPVEIDPPAPENDESSNQNIEQALKAAAEQTTPSDATDPAAGTSSGNPMLDVMSGSAAAESESPAAPESPETSEPAPSETPESTAPESSQNPPKSKSPDPESTKESPEEPEP